MPRPVLMSALVLRGQQLADMEGDTSISPSEWNSIASESYGEGYEIVADEGVRYFEYTTTLLTNGTNYVPEPDDQLSIVDQLELILNPTSGLCRRLKPILPQQRASLSGRTGQPRYYELVDGRYFLYPTPPAGQQLTLRYIGQCPDLTNYAGTQTVDCFCVAGQTFVQYAMAVAARRKSKNDISDLIPERDAQRELLRNWASNRMMTVQPVWYVDDDEGSDWLPQNWNW